MGLPEEVATAQMCSGFTRSRETTVLEFSVGADANVNPLAKGEEESGKAESIIPGCVAPLVRALFQYAKVVGSIPGQGTHKKQPMNA